MEPSSIYHNHQDQQRVLFTGAHSNLIARIVGHVLKHYGRSFDYVTDNQHESHPVPDHPTNSAVVLISVGSNHSLTLLEYHHHMLVMSDITPAQEEVFRKLADATPKAGILLYSETEPCRSIGKMERTDVTAVPFHVHEHKVSTGRILLTTENNENVPVRFSTPVELRSVHAAREVVRRMGVPTALFYTALAGFPA